MRPVSLRTSALMLTLIMVLMPLTPFAGQEFESGGQVEETLDEEIIMSSGTTGNADSLAFGLQSGCAVGASGNIKCWGDGSDGQLGLGNTQNIGDSSDETGTNLPFVNLGTNASVDKIVMGESHSCALFTNGSVKCWGESSVLGLGYSSSNGGFGDGYLETGDTLPFMQFPTGRTATMLEAGKSHTCAVMDNNDLICWGDNSKGQLGLGDTDKRGDSAGEIGTNFAVTSVPTGRTVDSLALGWDHTCAIWDNASVSCWGGNDNGQLGLDSTADIGDGASEMGDYLAFVTLPWSVTHQVFYSATQITAGDGFTCAVLQKPGTTTGVYCWGLNDYGQLGVESTTNAGDGAGTSMSSITETDLMASTIIALDAGEDHVCAIVRLTSGNQPVKCWGNGADGRLGYGSQDSRGTGPGSTNGMGSNLGYVRLTSSSTFSSYTAFGIEAGSGSTCVIIYYSVNTNDVICWGANGIGQLGYGDTEDRGDGVTDLPFVTELALELDEEAMENTCNILGVPEHRDELDRRLDSDSSDTGDLISMVEIPTTGCPAIAYYDSGSNNVKFAAYDNGMWAVETLGSDSGIIDVDIAIDANGNPHIVHMTSSGTDRVSYTTKVNGIWTEDTLTGMDGTEELSLSIDSNGDLRLLTVTTTELVESTCSSSCSSISNWANSNTLVASASIVDSSGDHSVHITSSGLYYSDSLGTPALVSTDVSSAYMATSMDVAPDGTISVAHTNDAYQTYYSSCSSGCTSASSWSTELVSNDTSSEVVLQFDGDVTPWILLTHNTTGATLFIMDNAVWNSQAISAWPGAADSFGLMINSAGYVFTSLHLVNPGELWAVTNPAVAGSGLYVDADGDGWTGMNEVSCGTDRMDSSSIPSDFDEDGRCDSMDTVNNLPAVGDSSVLTQGADFACAILDNGEIYCWGDNSYGKLGGSASGTSWPTGFEAVDIDAGENHACALSSAGEIMCWGRNNMGQIGTGAISTSESPTVLTLPNNHQAADLAVGTNHNCVTTTTSQIYCWGDGEDSQTGEYYVTDASAGYNDDFENANPSSIWTIEGSAGTFGTQWTIDTNDSSSGTSSFKSNGHGSNSDVGFSITSQFQSGMVSFDYKTDTCPTLSGCNDRLSFSIDGIEVNSSKGQMSNWSTYNTNITTGMHTLRWSFIKDGSAVNDANGDYVGVDDIQIRTGFRIESGGIIESPGIMNLDAGGLPQSITAGERHTCVTNHLNDVYCMGYNGGSSRMVLGNSSTTATNSSTLVKVDIGLGTDSVRTVTAGYDTSCAILDNSTQAVCWGQRSDWSDSDGATRSGELLLGSSTPSNDGTVVDIGNVGDRIYSIAMGESHACAIVENTIECWGVEESGSFGQGSSSTGAYSTPQVTSVPSGLTAKQIVIEHSTDSTCGVFEDSTGASTVICWGEQTAVGYSTSNPVTSLADSPVEDSNGVEILPSDDSQSPYDIVDLQSGISHTCALSRQGLIKCWGLGSSGQLGTPYMSPIGDNANEMGVHLQYIDLGQNITATEMSVGANHACAIVQSSENSSMNGKVMCWGRNYEKQTNASGNSNYVTTPQIANEFGNDVSKIAAGIFQTCALKTDGEVYCQGKDSERAIGSSSSWVSGHGTATALEYSTSGKFVDLYASSKNGGAICATSVTGATKCWGSGNYVGQTSANPVVFYDFNGILPSDLSFGTDFACLVVGATTPMHEATSPSTNVGDIVCWGVGTNGQLGTGSSSGYGISNDIHYHGNSQPINFNGTSMSDVESSMDHSCAISNSGEVYCWGMGSYGRLGYGNTNNLGDSSNELPFLDAVDLEGSAKLLSLTQSSSCVVMTDNEVYCWGDGGYGMTGHENTDDIGDQINEMGVHLSPTDLHMRPTDYDLDGIIDHWDTDDDNDGTLDTNDDFRLDPCAATDSDDDGMPDLIYSNCTTNLVEDLDDDNDLWNDTDEVACITNPISSQSIPFDTDSDGICNYIDTDDDNDGWSDIDEQLCEKKEWNTRVVHTTTSSSYYHQPDEPKGITFLPNNGIYTFQLQGLEMGSYSNKVFEFEDTATATTGHSRMTTVDSDTSDGFDYQTYGQGVYTVSSKEVWYSEYNAATNPTYGNSQVYTFNSSEQSNQHNMAVSEDGDVYLTTSDSIVQIEKGHLYGSYSSVTNNNELVSYIQYPDGVLNSTTGYGLGAYKQIEVDSNGNIHLLALHNVANRIYTWIYDIATDSWNSGLDSFPGAHGSIQPGRSSFSLDSSNQPHVVLMKGTSSSSADSSISYSFYDNTAQNWVERFNDGTPSGNYGVNLELDSNDDIHIAWVDRGNYTLYYTFLSGSTNQQSTTVIDTYATTAYVGWDFDVGLALDNGNDPWVYVQPYTSGSVARISRVAYFGSQNDNSTESTLYPGDYDGDGTCDMLEVATLDYGTNSLLFEMEMDMSYMPEYPAMMPTSVAISPSLPSGLTLNTATGEISGRVTSTDFAGSTYNISTTSVIEAWSGNITIKSTMENPLYTGYETMFATAYSDQTAAKTAFASNGEIVTLERYTSTSSIQVDGIAAGGNHDSDDLVLSMREPTGDYVWAKSIRGNSFFIEDVDVDDNGNIYALFQATATSSDPVEFNFDGVTIDNNGKITVILAKWDYYGNLQWAINTESTGTSSTDSAYVSTGSSEESSEMDLDKSTGDVAIIAKGKTANDDLKFGGMQIGPFGTCLSALQPWVAKVNTNGQVQWTAVGKSDPTNCRATDQHQVVLHHDGSVTTAGHVPSTYAWDYDFGSSSASGLVAGSNRGSSWIAHADSSGNWVWAENVTTKSNSNGASANQYFTMDKFSDDTLFFAYVSDTNYCTKIEFAGSSTSVSPTQSSIFCLNVATMNHTTSDVISLASRIGYHSFADAYWSDSIYSAVDSDDIAHVLIDMYNGHDLRTTGFDQDLNVAYDVVSQQWSSSHATTDFGLDNSGSIYFTGFHNSQFMYRTASLLSECGSDNTNCYGVDTWSSGQSGMSASGHRLYRFWGDYDHEINYNSPSEGASSSFDAIGYHVMTGYQLNDSAGNINNAALPCGLSFSPSSGTISGTPTNGCTDTANETYTITVNYGASSYVWNRNQSFEVTFGISPALPVVSYNPADTTQSYTRGVAITPIAPTGITNPANLHHFTTYPPLPAGLQVNSTGHIFGTPTANQSTAIFKVKSCNSWNVCSAGVAFTITIDEPAPVISYADSEYEFFKDVPITPVVPTSTGGVPSSWEISPDLPTGLSLRGDGAIIGIPFVDSLATNYTIWANNTGGSGTVVLEITVNGTGVFITYPYNTAELAQYSPMMALYPSTSGAAVVSWSIEPTLPSGVFFGTSNGTIYGTPNTLTDSTVYTINASGVEDYGTATVTLSVLLDTDLDGIPDVNDDDIDNDGWSNVDETNCQTDEMDENDYPSDIDQDRTCDLLDNSDDRSIIVIYLSDNVELSNDSAMNSLIPITAGGDIDTWEIYPALPLGLEFNGTMPGRSTSDTGTISGTPTELSPATVYTIWANNTNSGQIGSFQITLSVLLDTDGDGTPNVYDDDMDGDNWSNEMEDLCGEDPIDASSTPIDTDGDGLCNYIDSDDDNDTFVDTEEIMCNSNATDAFSVPIDGDNDGICDAMQSDRDLDGWADGPEESCGSDPDNASSVPTDSDGDMICDSLDDDRDGDGVGNNVDDFPDDRSAAKDTDGDGKPDSIVGVSETGLIEDYDDDNDNWSDYDESECGTDPLDDSEFPVDSDGDGTCDALEDDTDGDGVVDAEDAFPMDKDEWLDTDGDGVGDNADEDDDGDTWSDADEDRCKSDPLDSQSIPTELDEDDPTKCITTKSEPPKDSDDDSSSSTMWWVCVCFPLLLLLLLIPLMYWSKDRGDSLLVIMGMRNGPEPENTTANPGFVSGKGTKNEPFVLEPLHIKNFGDDIESKETITITNLDPDTMVSITDMANHTNRGRFNMDPIHVEGNVADKGKGSIVFRLNFDDNVTEDDISDVYQGRIRVGSSSVFILWDVKVGDPEADELASADKRAKEITAQEDAEKKAIKESEAKDKADKKAADKKAKSEAKASAEKEATDKKIKEAEEKAEAKASAEKEAADKKIKEAEEKAEAKASAEKEATDKKIKEAEEKAAAAEAKAAAAEDKAASEKKARENAEDSARVVAEQAAKERLEQMDKEMEERRAKLAEMDEKTRKKEEELLRISEKAKTIDFATIGVATSDQKDDLQRIKGVGPFIEDKLNALGIYTFEQVGNMTSKIEEQVNVAIEFFSGRIKRDKWANQAKQLSKKK